MPQRFPLDQLQCLPLRPILNNLYISLRLKILGLKKVDFGVLYVDLDGVEVLKKTRADMAQTHGPPHSV